MAQRAEQFDAADSACALQSCRLQSGFTCSGARATTFGYHVLVRGKVASVMPLLGLALSLISGVRPLIKGDIYG